jgi:hypothetical protein
VDQIEMLVVVLQIQVVVVVEPVDKLEFVKHLVAQAVQV